MLHIGYFMTGKPPVEFIDYLGFMTPFLIFPTIFCVKKYIVTYYHYYITIRNTSTDQTKCVIEKVICNERIIKAEKNHLCLSCTVVCNPVDDIHVSMQWQVR